MCVIIYKPKTQTISEDEVKAAWRTNPDGAGFAYVTAGGFIKYRRGIMNQQQLLEALDGLQNKELLLHFRISTSAGITPEGTHPYKLGNLLALEGITRKPVICMNGVISGQQLHKKQGVKLNDTASYIKDHTGAFKAVNEDILDIIEDATGCRWAAATTGGIILSAGFIEDNGLYYSNLNHKYTSTSWALDWLDYFKDDYTIDSSNCKHIDYSATLEDYLDEELLELLPDATRWELQDYVYLCCSNQNHSCKSCTSCLLNVESTKEAADFLQQNRHNITYGGY